MIFDHEEQERIDALFFEMVAPLEVREDGPDDILPTFPVKRSFLQKLKDAIGGMMQGFAAA